MKCVASFVVIYALSLGVTGIAVWLGMWYPRVGAACLFLGLPLLLALPVYALLRQAALERQLQLLKERIRALEDQKNSEIKEK